MTRHDRQTAQEGWRERGEREARGYAIAGWWVVSSGLTGEQALEQSHVLLHRGVTAVGLRASHALRLQAEKEEEEEESQGEMRWDGMKDRQRQTDRTVRQARHSLNGIGVVVFTRFRRKTNFINIIFTERSDSLTQVVSRQAGTDRQHTQQQQQQEEEVGGGGGDHSYVDL